MSKKKFTPKQKAFADEYIINGNNIYQASKKAGYSEKYSLNQAYLLLEHEHIKEYIAEKTKEASEKTQYTIDDVIEKLFKRAMGEQYEKPFKEYDNLEQETVVDTIRYITPSDKEQNQAADMLLKMSGRYIEKQQIEMTSSVQFVDDIDEED